MSWNAVAVRRSSIIGMAAALLASIAVPSVRRRTWPTQTIRLIVPFPAGGSNDVMGRLIAPHLEKALGQTVIVDNRPAAAGQVGTEAVARATPDGHTLLLVASSHTVQPALNPKLPYNTEKDFAPVSLVNTNAMFFFVHPSVPANTLAEFVELAKKEPGKYNYASPGVGSQTQLTIELLMPPHRHQAAAHSVSRRRAGHAGDAQRRNAFHHAGAERHLSAYRSPARSARSRPATASGIRGAPNVSTTAEQGFKGLEAIQWVGVLTTAGTPRPVIDRLNKEINRIIQLPDVVAVLDKQGVAPTGGTPEEFQALITREINQWRDIAREANIKLN